MAANVVATDVHFNKIFQDARAAELPHLSSRSTEYRRIHRWLHGERQDDNEAMGVVFGLLQGDLNNPNVRAILGKSIRPS